MLQRYMIKGHQSDKKIQVISPNMAEKGVGVIKESPADSAFRPALDWNSRYGALGSNAFLSPECVSCPARYERVGWSPLARTHTHTRS